MLLQHSTPIAQQGLLRDMSQQLDGIGSEPVNDCSMLMEKEDPIGDIDGRSGKGGGPIVVGRRGATRVHYFCRQVAPERNSRVNFFENKVESHETDASCSKVRPDWGVDVLRALSTCCRRLVGGSKKVNLNGYNVVRQELQCD
jgi:hypothetical protein